MKQNSISRELEEGMRQLGLYSSSDDLAAYLALLHKWNQIHNLTAVREQHLMVTRHVLDSLAILPFIKGKRIIDVGSGAGLPGIPIALLRPDLEIVLLDSQIKKVSFLEEAKRILNLKQVEIVHARVEEYKPEAPFDTVMSRAFSDLSQMIQWTEHLLMPQGIWVAMKGRLPGEELSALKYPYKVEPYQVPGLEGSRCCIIIKKE